MAAEKIFENKIKAYLDEIGAYWIKYWGGGQFTKAGIPDLLCCVGGYFLAIEVKAQNGRPSELQLHHIQKIRESGGFAIVLYPSGYWKFKEFVDNLKNGYFSDTREMDIIFK